VGKNHTRPNAPVAKKIATKTRRIYFLDVDFADLFGREGPLKKLAFLSSLMIYCFLKAGEMAIEEITPLPVNIAIRQTSLTRFIQYARGV